MLKKLLWGMAILLLVAAVAVTAYGGLLWGRIEKRFSARRWQVPSTLYSDTTLLYPGQPYRLEVLKRKLTRLGYKQTAAALVRKGDMHLGPSTTEIYLRDLATPARNRPGFPVTVRFEGERIQSIERTDQHVILPLLELEPEEIGQFYGSRWERRQLVSIKQVPTHLIHAVLAAEDARFYEHHGFDPRGILRAVYINVRYGAIRQGGSTITQQLAKNYFLTAERTFSRKFTELMMALVMELKYEKDEILEIYLNEIYMGQKGSAAVNGVGEAARFYFGKAVQDLSLVEAALLAGLIKSPGHYSPFVDLQRSRQRRDAVLQAMETRGWITQRQLQRALTIPVDVVKTSTRDNRAPYFMDYLAQQLETLYSHQNLSSLGMSIFTTLDTEVQDAAEQALQRGLARLERANPSLRRSDPQQQLQGALVVMQPKTGYLLALVGGRDYRVSQYNRAVQSRRQPGSAFKPFVYLAALDELTPASRLSNMEKTYTVNGKPWQPQNFSDDFALEVSMRKALTRSHNRATVDLAMRTGLDRLVELTSKFQFSTPLKAYPSLALGAFEVVPLELARAYCALAAEGVLPYPISLKDVADENGRVLQRTHISFERATTPARAFVVSDMLTSVVTEGTARSLRQWGLYRSVAGKTGTTNDFRDAWFIGYTPDILALVWVGFDNGEAIHNTGASAALPIWAELMQALPRYLTGGEFRRPAGVVVKTVCSESGLLSAGRTCPFPMQEYFLEDNVPTESCPLHAPKNRLKRIIDGIKGMFD
jgi:penicillin-binding protein 1B